MSNFYYVIRQDFAEGQFQDWHRVSAQDPELAAVKTAEFDHSHHDGWEWHWPIVYLVADESGRAWTVDVAREMVPDFYGSGAEDTALPDDAMPPCREDDEEE
jgi:hypothetical protein